VVLAVMVVVVMVIAAVAPTAHDDAAMVLTWAGAGRIVVGQDWRGGAGEKGRAEGGDQETLHSLFLLGSV
jgi:hypothetical protein